MKEKKLTASALKEILWNNLQKLEGSNADLDHINSSAGQVREILRTVNVQIKVAKMQHKAPSKEIIEFVEGK